MSHFTVTCAHCYRDFDHPRRSGRRRVYCGRSCRQRAYEVRRDRRRPPAHPLRPEHLGHRDPTTTERTYRPAHMWLEGQARHGLGKLHVVVSGAPDGRGRFPTLCGTHAHAGNRGFSPLREGACETCSTLTSRYPPTNANRPAYDLLSTQGHLIQLARALQQADRDGGAEPEQLRSFLRRCFQPVAPHLALGLPLAQSGRAA